MRRGLVIIIGLAVALAPLAGPASAKKKKKIKPVPTALYLHGASALGEMDSFFIVAEGYLPMDPNEPGDGPAKSRSITNYIVGPNTQCAGNNLFPVWSGSVTGRIKGDMTFSFTAAGTPGPVEIRVWPDVTSSLCNSETTGAADYPEPAGAVTVDLPPGQGTVEAVIEDVDFTAFSSVIVQVSPVVLVDIPSPAGALLSPSVSRILYDSTQAPSVLKFSCIPAKGKLCTPS